MSLKAFHIVFITASTLLSMGFGGWCLHSYAHGGGPGHLALGVGSLAAAVALVVYGRAVLKKLKHISYL